ALRRTGRVSNKSSFPRATPTSIRLRRRKSKYDACSATRERASACESALFSRRVHIRTRRARPRSSTGLRKSRRRDHPGGRSAEHIAVCGIAGIVRTGNERVSLEELDRMVRALTRRGPDGKGVWHHRDLRVALGHTRLAVIDLSERGHQPMVSASGNFVVTFN